MNSINPKAGKKVHSFQNFLSQLNRIDDTEKEGYIQAYLKDQLLQDNIPIIDERSCTFIYYGSNNKVAIEGDFTGWDSEEMTKVQNTDLWFFTKTFPNDARLDYLITIDGISTLDFGNRRLVPSGFGYRSYIEMPQYKPSKSIEFNDHIPHGTVETIENFSSAIFNNTREIKIYLPPNYNPSIAYPCLFITDGLEYLQFAQFNNVLDNLLYNKKIRELLAIFIPPINRNMEYFIEKEKFCNFLLKEVKPFIDKKYAIINNPSECGLMGASLGGLISVFTSINNEDTLGLIASQSGYFPEDFMGIFSKKVPNVKFYFDVGVFETSIGSNSNFLQMNREMKKIVDAKGFNYYYQEVNEGHSWGSWRARLKDILMYLFPMEE
ncbi:MAG: alpha/beta hydrolase-fold protein [Promethearchaeota archaeon]